MHARAAVARGGRWGRWLLSAAVLVAPACRCSEAAPSASVASTAPVVVIPRQVLAEIFVLARGRLGAPHVLERALGFRPLGFSAVAVEMLGIPAPYAPQVTLERPVTGVVVDAAPARVVLALPVSSGRELVAALTTGKSPTHRAATTTEPTVVVLERQGGAGARELALGVTGNVLLVGARRGSLLYGPTRRARSATAMPRGPIEIVVPRSALEPLLSAGSGSAG